MTTSTTTPPDPRGVINVRRVSLHAYDTAIHAARATTQGTAQSSATSDTDRQAWAELEDAGLAQDGSLDPQWAHALDAAPSAPVQINVVAQQEGVTFTTDVVLLPGLGLATTQRSITDPGSDTERREPAVELVAFSPEEVWPVVRRVLPPVEAMRADPRPTPSGDRDTLPAPDGMDRSCPQVSLLVSAHRDGALVPMGLHQWALRDGQLYSFRPHRKTLTTVDPGAIAHEVIYLVTGAYSAAATDLTNEASQ